MIARRVCQLVQVMAALALVACASGGDEPGESCGNGVVEAGEVCDDGNDHGHDGCTGDCQVEPGYVCTGFAPSICTLICGNGVIDTGEACDGSEMAGATCQILGYQGGQLGCVADCTFDESGCTGTPCGNGTIETGESCDGSSLGGQSCASRGFTGGQLQCAADCTFDESACVDTCGNGTLDAGEPCDGIFLGSATCESLGFVGGDLACALDCVYNTSGCFSANCGNGMKEPGEECDGNDLDEQDCTDHSFLGGDLACGGDCTFDTSGCANSVCGNSTVEAGEQCDDGNTGSGDGCSSTCQWETTCSSSETISCGDTDYDDAMGGSDSVANYSAACGSNSGTSDERVYAFTPATSGSVDVDLYINDTMDDDFDLYVLEASCHPGLCIAHGATSGNESVTFSAQAGVTYYIVVEFDYWWSTWGDYQLSVDCN